MKILMLIYSDSFILNSILTRAIRIPLEFTQQTLTTSARDFWSLLRTSYFHFSEARIVREGGGGAPKIKESATLGVFYGLIGVFYGLIGFSGIRNPCL